MSMIANVLLGTLIFGYAGWTLVRFVNKSKQGKCAGCAMKKTCSTACSHIEAERNISS